MRATAVVVGLVLPSVAAPSTAAAAAAAATATTAQQQQGGPMRLAWWVDGPVNGGCPGWGMPYPGYNVSFKSQESCWGNTLDLITNHASLIDEVDLSVGFRFCLLHV